MMRRLPSLDQLFKMNNITQDTPGGPKMSSRKKARRYALQALYSWLVSGNEIQNVETYFLSQHDDDFDKEYFHTLLFEVAHHSEAIDEFMKPYLNISLEDLDYIEYSLLRLAVYELQYRQDVPYRVVINEALELAKAFGAKDSYKFVNGVLDKIARATRTEAN